MNWTDSTTPSDPPVGGPSDDPGAGAALDPTKDSGVDEDRLGVGSDADAPGLGGVDVPGLGDADGPDRDEGVRGEDAELVVLDRLESDLVAVDAAINALDQLASGQLDGDALEEIIRGTVG